jgi:hypothetical protein
MYSRTFNKDGYDNFGFNKNGIHKNGTKYGDDGRDVNRLFSNGSPYDSEGYDFYGYDVNGYDRSGYDMEGIGKKSGIRRSKEKRR